MDWIMKNATYAMDGNMHTIAESIAVSAMSGHAMNVKQMRVLIAKEYGGADASLRITNSLNALPCLATT
jgi:hypothetical protein